MTIMDGKALSGKVQARLKRQVNVLRSRGITPGLAVVMVGDNPASSVYVRNKQAYAEAVGVKFLLKKFPANISSASLAGEIDKLNNNSKIHGIILQLPLPTKLKSLPLLMTIDPAKDVDGLHPVNLGLLASGRPLFQPATPKGILALLDEYKIKIEGKHVVVVGFGQVVGMPLSLMLAQRGATVSIAHDKTKNLSALTLQADILISAAGVPGLIKTQGVKRGAAVVDAGISKRGSKFVGDVDFTAVSKKAGYITPVPGGVGPMTVSSLISNVVEGAKEFAL